jgi:hypothetical protein
MAIAIAGMHLGINLNQPNVEAKVLAKMVAAYIKGRKAAGLIRLSHKWLESVFRFFNRRYKKTPNKFYPWKP